MFYVLQSNLPYLLQGAIYTVILSVIVVSCGTVLGVGIGVLAAVGGKLLRSVITTYIFVFRGIPVLVVMFLGFYSFPALGLRLDAYTAVAISMIVYVGAFVAEATRGAIAAVPAGQMEAAKSIGMHRGTIMREIILPQAMRLLIAPVLNISLMAIKQTSYASIVGAWELSFAAREVVERTLAAFQIFLGVMIIYFIICYPLSLAARALEKRLAFDH
ncbi:MULTISPECIES: amino acid ABC transporter permease [Sinorhizobium]|uniref:amino acid ABC transporter permease n=1 Tax=Sinorhizobium TaxID=28105 RepID=UPI0004B1C1F8|nr:MULTISPECIES: amino acid ABC transporter permease [Sinorhizobium]ASY60647.1 polar amino acid ABC transporter, inner membrane subunit [Sinorhizobium sp. CCBAU 05631]ASY74179.1 polar amino acid ABC transporter, inner membrane subunit [Sinorhizobium fredii CCBAU 83666]